ncbi:DUF2937 family protein [Nereida sp. MMG025]|uniref:DUF2937 family protein n=1 Tax=Nereida sp. MMG025 TaxID=2909981 RepID=UPI001F44BCB6|nr:DUF2937 family protein [Nereida sp. MMG025]MCF6443900.1 DUF2937 family protein [Nereida sp. MMG025]
MRLLRSLAVGLGLCGGALTAQFPEYAQQYVQRLGGAVDELNRVVEDFDTSAREFGLTRAAALEAMAGSDFVGQRSKDMSATIARADRLQADLAALQGASTTQKLLHFPRLTDPDIAKAAWHSFEPAVQLTPQGILFAFAGYVIGWGSSTAVGRIIARLFRRKQPKPA